MAETLELRRSSTTKPVKDETELRTVSKEHI